MTKALANRNLTQDQWELILRIAPILKDSRLFGVSTLEQAMAILLKGFELNLPFTTALELIHVIESKPSLSPRGGLALVLNSPDFAGMDIQEETAKDGTPIACTVTFKRTNGMVYTSRFSMEDALRAGLVRPGSGWEKFPANMLRWRAIGYATDVVFPDVTGGLKRADELGADLTPDGDVVDGDWSLPPVDENQSVISSTERKGANPIERLQELLVHYSAEEITAANGGKIPSTHEEVDAVIAAIDVDFYSKGAN